MIQHVTVTMSKMEKLVDLMVLLVLETTSMATMKWNMVKLEQVMTEYRLKLK